MADNVKITHVVFNKEDTRFNTSFVDGDDKAIGEIELIFYSTISVEPCIIRSSLKSISYKTGLFSVEDELSDILQPLLNVLA